MSDSHFDTREFRNACGRFASGVTVVTALEDDKTHGMTANAFVSVSLEPPTVLVSLGNKSFLHKVLPSIGRYGISVLAEDQEALSNHFAGRTAPGLHLRFTKRHGMPLLEGAVAYFVVRVVDAHPAGDHTLYIGQVEHFEWHEEKPLLFYGGQYQKMEKPKLPKWPEDGFSLFSIGSFDPPIT